MRRASSEIGWSAVLAPRGDVDFTLDAPSSSQFVATLTPRDWMVPLKRGQQTDLIEIPASWYLDDLPPMMFIKKSPNSHGFVNPRDIEEMWRDQFDWVYREYDYAVFPMTIHPDVSGRPHVLMMLERLYHHMIGHPGVRFVTMNEMADDFARRSPRKK